MKAIYGIVNKINGHKYVGSAVNFYKRKTLHLRQLKKNEHHSVYLQRAWNRYGEDVFEFIILEKVDKKEELLIREQWWIDNSNNEYNVCKVAGSSLGVKRSEETKEKCRLSHLGEKHPEWRRKLKSISQGGKNNWQYGKKMSDKVKQKKSESMIEYYKKNQHSMKGKKNPMTNQSKQSMIDKLSIPIQQFSKEGEFIRDWKSIKEAGKSLNIHSTNIVTCLKGKTKTSGGFIWKYKI